MVFLTVADYEKAMRHSIFNQQFDQYAGIKLVSNYAGIVRQLVILARGTQIQRALAHPTPQATNKPQLTCWALALRPCTAS